MAGGDQLRIAADSTRRATQNKRDQLGKLRDTIGKLRRDLADMEKLERTFQAEIDELERQVGSLDDQARRADQTEQQIQSSNNI